MSLQPVYQVLMKQGNSCEGLESEAKCTSSDLSQDWNSNQDLLSINIPHQIGSSQAQSLSHHTTTHITNIASAESNNYKRN